MACAQSIRWHVLALLLLLACAGLLACGENAVFTDATAYALPTPSPSDAPVLAYAPPAPPLITIPAATPSPSATATPVATPELVLSAPALQEGEKHEVVATLQKRLMELGYFDQDTVTDYFGTVTKSAVMLFQRVQEAPQDGVVTEDLLSLLFSDEALPYHIKREDTGEDVESMQLRLAALGYFSEQATGFFGPATEKALLRFQKRNKLDETGIADTETLDVLYSFKARHLIDPTPTPKLTPTPTPGGKSGTTGKGVDAFVSTATDKKGKPYVWGGQGPDSFDCSGFVHYCLTQVGKGVGRVKALHYSQYEDWLAIDKLSACLKGDLLFFRSDDDPNVNHMGIYLGGNQFIHASFTAGKVTVSSLTEYYKRNFINARRVF